MIVIDSIEAMRQKYPLSEEEQKLLRIPYSPDMFRDARDIVRKYGYAVACREDGEELLALRREWSMYLHSYRYAGGLDLWLLDQYSCLFLYECNEFSVELCRRILPKWTGERLILLGEEWERLESYLPELVWHGETMLAGEAPPGQIVTSETASQLAGGKPYLQVVHGIPHAETPERYERDHIAYYDEVMALTFLFSDVRECGDRNEGKRFFIMDGAYDSLGLFAIFGKATIGALYAKSRGYTPVIRIVDATNSIYSNGVGDDIWEKFYEQPEDCEVADVLQSRHVTFAPSHYNGTIMEHLMQQQYGDLRLTWPKGIYSDRIKEYIREREGRFLPHPERTLGVIARGTDYVNTTAHLHAKHASKEMLAEKIDEVMDRWGVEEIFIATEDASYCRYFEECYGEKAHFTDQERYETKPGELLVQMHQRIGKHRDGFLPGAEYILAIHLLARCKCLIASGACAGLGKALEENGGRYTNTYVFDLGVNE
ncbi:MAG: hypothetical protein K6B72_12805 [Lachnospiraceae bacterium]|nr:hypothetical protein [Lachnospiraceae bacterium]